MSNTLLETSKKPEVGTKVTKTVIDFQAAVPEETAQQFELRVFKAQRHGFNYVEANKDILDEYNPEGLGSATYFDYKGMRVYAAGTKLATEEFEKQQNHQRIHGEKGWHFEGQTRW
jgi:hypothetical protein